MPFNPASRPPGQRTVASALAEQKAPPQPEIILPIPPMDAATRAALKTASAWLQPAPIIEQEQIAHPAVVVGPAGFGYKTPGATPGCIITRVTTGDDAIADIGATLAGSIQDRVAATVANAAKVLNPYPYQKPHGGHVKPPRAGSKGIAGARADLRDGKLTLQELAGMSLAQIGKRYRVSPAGGRTIKRYLLRHGLDGAVRFADGSLRPK